MRKKPTEADKKRWGEFWGYGEAVAMKALEKQIPRVISEGNFVFAHKLVLSAKDLLVLEDGPVRQIAQRIALKYKWVGKAARLQRKAWREERVRWAKQKREMGW